MVAKYSLLAGCYAARPKDTRTRQRPLWQRLLAARKTESGYEERWFQRAFRPGYATIAER